MSLQVWLPLNGDLHNQGASGISATNTNAVINTAGKIGSCYYMQDTTSTIYTDLFTPETNNFSFCCWYKAETSTSGYVLGLSRAKEPSLMLFKDGATKFRLYLNSYSIYTHNLDITEWHHYAVTYDSNKAILYIDGQSQLEREQTVDFTSNEYRLFFAARSDRTNTNGGISNHCGPCYYNDVRYYNHCLSAAEVKEISQGLVLHYKLDDLTNGILDSSGYGHNGTVIHGTASLSSNTARYSASMEFNGYQNPTIDSTNSSFLSALTSCTVTWWEYVTVSGNNLPIRAQDTQHYIGAGSTTRKLYHNNIGSVAKLYKDGIAETSSKYNNVTLTSGDIVYTQNQWSFFALSGADLSTWTKIELNGYSSTWPVNGNISDLRIYCTALSADDILQLYHTSAKVDNLGGFHTFELSETNNGLELLAVPLTTSYGNHTNIYTGYDSNGEITMTGGSSIGSYYIPINPSGKTYYYDIEVSTDSGNVFYIGFQRYDANKTARSNDATVYLPGLGGSSEARTHKHYHGTVDLSTDSVNPCAFTSLRILNDWSGANGRKATIHKISLREVSTLQNTKINKYGQAITAELIEMNDKFCVQKNGIIEANGIIEL